jgi:microcystin-dependent protein
MNEVIKYELYISYVTWVNYKIQRRYVMEVYLGTIMPWPMEFAPYGWMFCRGQALPVTQYQALFSLLGTRYGGNGSSTFCLPDLQGRAIAGVSSTDQNFQIAHTIGQKQATYNLTNLPAHAHTFSSFR